MKNSVVVFRNTIVLYVKVISTTLIWLYLTRVVLDNLGIVDYGIYSLIAGVIAVLAFVNSALMSSTQRFLSIAIGEGNEDKLHKYYVSGIHIHITIAIVLLIVLESIRPFLFNGFLNIPVERIVVAEQIYQLMIISTCITIVGAPFSAAINAYEDIWFQGLVQIVCTLLKLGVIVGFVYFGVDKLLLYSIWMTVASLLEMFTQYIWCKLKYRVCNNNNLFKFDRQSISEMFGFAVWNTLGAFAVVGRNQGVATVLNYFFGPRINGVFGIANQVDGQLISFANTLTSAMTPQIVKSHGQGNNERLIFLSLLTSKLTFFMSAVFAIPLLIELPLVLSVWLKEVPEHTEMYCRLVLYIFLVCELYPGLVRGIQAVGIIKWQQILTSIIVLLPIPIGIVAFKLGASHFCIVYLMLISQIASLGVTVCFAVKLFGLDIRKYFKFVFFAGLSFFPPLIFGQLIDNMMLGVCSNLVRFLAVVAISVLLFISLFFICGFDKNERALFLSLVSSFVKKSR